MENGYEKWDIREISISLKDMLMRVCLSWRALLVWAVIFAIIFNCMGVYKSYQAVETAKETTNISSEEIHENELASIKQEISNAKSELSLREAEEVERAADTYSSLLVKYNNALEYSHNSVKMRLDANQVPTATLEYTVDNHYLVEYPVMDKRDNTSSIINAIGNRILSDDICEKIAEKMGEDVSVSMVKELINTEGVEGNVKISMVALTIEDCKVMVEAIKDSIPAISDELVKVYGDFDINLVMETYGTRANANVLNDQTTQMNNINLLKNGFNNLSSSMNERQKNYYNALLDSISLETKDESATSIEQIDLGNERLNGQSNAGIQIFHAKQIILGIILGILLVCVGVTLKYLFDGNMRIPEDMEGGYGLGIIGILEGEKRKNSIIDRNIRKWFGYTDGFTKEEHMKMACAGIRIYARKHALENIFITSSCNDKEIKDILCTVCEELEKDIKSIQYGASIVYDPESFEKMSKADGVVIFEKIAMSKYKDISNEVDRCKINQIPILGCVVVK